MKILAKQRNNSVFEIIEFFHQMSNRVYKRKKTLKNAKKECDKS